ncbi:LOW QUALITY PROTEIN: hypothetical protein V1478_004821 [Vespula squamosa]|uniref:Uncharacterized protein n=1 Tax=Vespula squamosa TaxID=30214 RepID=A0ABD2BEW2_VESSQ
MLYVLKVDNENEFECEEYFKPALNVLSFLDTLSITFSRTIDFPSSWANQASMKDHVQPPTPDSFLQLSSLPSLLPLSPPPPPPPLPSTSISSSSSPFFCYSLTMPSVWPMVGWLPCSKRYGSFYIRNVLPPFLPSPRRVARFLDPFSSILEGDSRKYLTLPEIPGRRGSHSAKFSRRERKNESSRGPARKYSPSTVDWGVNRRTNDIRSEHIQSYIMIRYEDLLQANESISSVAATSGLAEEDRRRMDSGEGRRNTCKRLCREKIDENLSTILIRKEVLIFCNFSICRLTSTLTSRFQIENYQESILIRPGCFTYLRIKHSQTKCIVLGAIENHIFTAFVPSNLSYKLYPRVIVRAFIERRENHFGVDKIERLTEAQNFISKH